MLPISSAVVIFWSCAHRERAPAAGHGIDPKPYSVHLGITNTSTAGFKLVLGASVSAIAVGGFAGAKTTA